VTSATDDVDESPEHGDVEVEDEPPLDPVAEEARRVAADKALRALSVKEWRTIERKLTAMARALGILEANAADFAQQAIELVLSHEKKWDPTRPLLPFLRVVLRSRVDAYFDSAQVKHEVAPDSARDENVPRSDPQIEQAKVALEERDASNDRFAEMLDILKDEPVPLGVVRASQKGIDKAEDQAAYLHVAIEEVYAARKRVKAVFKRVYKQHDDAPRLPKLASRGMHTKAGRGSNEGDEP
jgi:hypothetical protein